MRSANSDTSILRLFREMLAKLATERRKHRCLSPELSDAWDNAMEQINILTTVMMLEGWNDDAPSTDQPRTDDPDAEQLE